MQRITLALLTAALTGAAAATLTTGVSQATAAPAVPAPPSMATALDTASFAGGCFWSMQRPFEHVPGVTSTFVGYEGGHTSNPTYEQVGTRSTGHAETVEVVYDPSKLSYDKLLEVYWHNVDPVTKERQFCDGGNDYRTVVFYRNDAQRHAAEQSMKVVQQHFKQPVATEIVPASTFWMAEEYHQHFAARNPIRYNAYRIGCGRDDRLKELWGDRAAPYVPKS